VSTPQVSDQRAAADATWKRTIQRSLLVHPIWHATFSRSCVSALFGLVDETSLRAQVIREPQRRQGEDSVERLLALDLAVDRSAEMSLMKREHVAVPAATRGRDL
jgi:hypothetical protein